MNNHYEHNSNDKLGKGSILVVDDQPENIRLLSDMLESQGFDVRGADSGALALEFVKLHVPDLILLDIRMPEMDGYDVCMQLKSDDRTRDVPVIFISAMGEIEDIVKGFEIGAVDYITKPFNIVELLSRVRTHLELRFSRELILRQNADLKEMLHILSHDLVNPVGGILMMLEMAEQKPDHWFVKQRKSMKAEVENLLSLFDMVREMRALEENKLNLTLTSVNLKKALHKSISMLRYKFSQKNIEICTGVDEKLNVWVEKRSFVNSVLNNILTNAVKFSFPGSKIEINALNKSKEVVLEIKDYGIGMSKKLQKNLFLINKKTTRLGTNGEEGTGFGMPLIKKFVTIYGGEIKISSKEKKEFPDDHGTLIRLILKSA